MRFNINNIKIIESNDILLVSCDNIEFKFDNTDKIASKELVFIFEEVFVKSCYYDYFLEELDNIVVIDIGANRLLASIFFASMKNVKKIYAFEPMPSNIERAKKNIDLNLNFSSKIELLPFGLSDSDKEVEVTYDKHEPGRAKTSSHMNDPFAIRQSITEKALLKEAQSVISKVINDNLDSNFIIKIDCEGSEYDILSNLDDDIYSKIKYITGEYHIPDKQIYDLLVRKGFVVHIFADSTPYFPNYGTFRAIKR